MGPKSAKNLNFLLFILAGVVIGGFIGEYLGGIPYLSWLRFGDTFGMASPLILDLGIISLTFGLSVTINIAGLLGVVIAIIIFRRL